MSKNNLINKTLKEFNKKFKKKTIPSCPKCKSKLTRFNSSNKLQCNICYTNTNSNKKILNI